MPPSCRADDDEHCFPAAARRATAIHRDRPTRCSRYRSRCTRLRSCRGWDEDEVYRLLVDGAVLTHRAMIRRTLVGFIMSRLAADEAEILSVAIAPARRGRGLSRPLLDFHLRRLAGRAVRTVFLEVDEQNAAACRLYAAARLSTKWAGGGLLWQRRRRPGATPRPWLTLKYPNCRKSRYDVRILPFWRETPLWRERSCQATPASKFASEHKGLSLGPTE